MKKGLVVLIWVFYALIAYAEPHAPITINVIEETLIVDGKAVHVFNLVQPDGTVGYVGKQGEFFNINLINHTSVPISIHWHGLVLPNNQDGVPYVTQLPLAPGTSRHYYFKLLQAGTYWMHSHYKFHEQALMAAPLIIHDATNQDKNIQNVVVMLQDISFIPAEKIYAQLKQPKKKPMTMSAKPDLNDVHYPVYLANRHTLRNPEIIQVKPKQKIRLRFINAASATNFWITTGQLVGNAIAVDGENIQPLTGQQFQLALAQRIDVMITLPEGEGAYPVLAQAEGTQQQTGILLVTPHATIPILKEKASKIAPALNDDQEKQLHALHPLAKRPINKTLNYHLGGDMQTYVWTINNEVWPHINPLEIKQGDRVAMVFVNDTSMAHPMHFHGHVFQVTEMDGKRIENGPLRDTILVLPHKSKTIVFDATNPGIWMLHCHVLYHLIAGMMTTTNYLHSPEPEFYKELLAGKITDTP